MSSINTNVTAMAAIRSLSMITGQMSKTQAAVESGLRINKANDDPAVFSIAQTMRADLKGLNAVRDGLAFGKATLTVARDAATKISNELATLKQTVTQGQQQGLDKETMNAQVSNLLNNIRSFAETATFNGVNLLNNSAAGDRELRVLRDITGRTINVDNQRVISDVASGSRLLNLDNLDVDQGGIRITPPATMNPKDGDFVAVKVGDREFVFEFNADTGTGPNTGRTNFLRELSTPQSTDRTLVEVKIGTGANLTPQQELSKLVDAMRANGIGARISDDGSIEVFGANITRVAYSFETEAQRTKTFVNDTAVTAGATIAVELGGETFSVAFVTDQNTTLNAIVTGLNSRGFTAERVDNAIRVTGDASLVQSLRMSISGTGTFDGAASSDGRYTQQISFGGTAGATTVRFQIDGITNTQGTADPEFGTNYFQASGATEAALATEISTAINNALGAGRARVIGTGADSRVEILGASGRDVSLGGVRVTSGSITVNATEAQREAAAEGALSRRQITVTNPETNQPEVRTIWELGSYNRNATTDANRFTAFTNVGNGS
ncbi:MAG: flagellin, partial [Acetobacteraceae bacterium]